MKIFLKCLLVFISIFNCTAQATNFKINYPPILDFYPSCSYKIIKNYSAKSEINDSSKQEEITSRVLLKIRETANAVGADAVILVAKEMKRTITFDKVPIFIMKYEAELIKLCNEDSHDPKRLTAYNHLGNKSTRTSSKTTKLNTYSHTFNHSNTIHRPKIIDKEVSIENGVYGVKLNDSYQNVISILGTPNTTINIFTDEFIIGYGRRHWLHFQDNKLVKIQTNSSFLSQSTINKIPFLDFFDDFEWKINNKVAYKTQFVDVNRAFKTAGKLNNNHQLIIENNADKLTLFFNKYKVQNKHGTHHVLNGFSLEKKAYKPLINKIPIERKKHFNVLTKIMVSLHEKQSINFDIIKPQLGEAIGSIKLSKREQIIIFNNNLFLQIRGNDIRNITLIENIFVAGLLDDIEATPWYLGKFIQGQSIELLRKHFPTDSFELDNKVEVDTDEYQLSLLFDEMDDGNSLYEAKIILY